MEKFNAANKMYMKGDSNQSFEQHIKLESKKGFNTYQAIVALDIAPLFHRLFQCLQQKHFSSYEMFNFIQFSFQGQVMQSNCELYTICVICFYNRIPQWGYFVAYDNPSMNLTNIRDWSPTDRYTLFITLS